MNTEIDRLPTAEKEDLSQITEEIITAFSALENVKKGVAIYGSSRTEESHIHYKDTYKVAKLLAENKYSIITGGGPAIMKAANKGARDGGGLSVGLHIYLPNEQNYNEYLDINVYFRHFFTRKLAFSTFSTAYVIMPGGTGTLDELTEAMVLMQTGKMQKVPIIFYNKEFWSGLLEWIKASVLGAGYIHKEELSNIYLVESPSEVLEILKKFEESPCACK